MTCSSAPPSILARTSSIRRRTTSSIRYSGHVAHCRIGTALRMTMAASSTLNGRSVVVALSSAPHDVHLIPANSSFTKRIPGTLQLVGDQHAALCADRGLAVLSANPSAEVDDVAAQPGVGRDLHHEPLDAHGFVSEHWSPKAET